MFKNLILFLTLILMTQSAFCYCLTYDNLNSIVKTKALNEAKKALSSYNAEIKVNIQGIPKENIITRDNSIPKVEIINQQTTFNPNSYKRVVIKDGFNNVVKVININVQTLIYKDVLVANEQIPFNGEINNKNTILAKKEISRFLGNTYSSNISNFIAKRNFPKGSIILSNGVKEKSVIAKNSMVDIVFLSSKGLKIRLQGKALKEGAMGESIPVRSNTYNKTYNAIVHSSSEVIVRI